MSLAIKQKAKKVALLLTICLFTWFSVHTLVVIIDGLNDELSKTDVAVVLGNKVKLNGQPSNRLKARLDKAVELYHKEYVNHIIVSGGIGKEGYDEAKVMKAYLIDKGIEEGHVIMDHSGYNTMKTAENTKMIMDNMKYESITVITQFFHITRTKLAFKKAGLENVYSAHAEFFENRDIYSTIREFPAYYKYLIQ